jgi:hypothetical protein
MNQHKVPIRQQIEKIDAVTRTWLEWDLLRGATTKALIVEVDFDTDSHATSSHRGELLQKIWTVYGERNGTIENWSTDDRPEGSPGSRRSSVTARYA